MLITRRQTIGGTIFSGQWPHNTIWHVNSISIQQQTTDNIMLKLHNWSTNYCLKKQFLNKFLKWFEVVFAQRHHHHWSPLYTVVDCRWPTSRHCPPLLFSSSPSVWNELPCTALHSLIQSPVWNTTRHVCILRLRNDLYCVGWGVELYSLTHVCTAPASFLAVVFWRLIFSAVPFPTFCSARCPLRDLWQYRRICFYHLLTYIISHSSVRTLSMKCLCEQWHPMRKVPGASSSSSRHNGNIGTYVSCQLNGNSRCRNACKIAMQLNTRCVFTKDNQVQCWTNIFQPW